MSEPFLGEIRMVGFNFAPRGAWITRLCIREFSCYLEFLFTTLPQARNT